MHKAPAAVYNSKRCTDWQLTVLTMTADLVVDDLSLAESDSVNITRFWKYAGQYGERHCTFE